jgi:hypothetical protein
MRDTLKVNLDHHLIFSHFLDLPPYTLVWAVLNAKQIKSTNKSSHGTTPFIDQNPKYKFCSSLLTLRDCKLGRPYHTLYYFLRFIKAYLCMESLPFSSTPIHVMNTCAIFYSISPSLSHSFIFCFEPTTNHSLDLSITSTTSWSNCSTATVFSPFPLVLGKEERKRPQAILPKF